MTRCMVGVGVVFCACRIRIPCINRTSIYQCIALLTKLREFVGRFVEVYMSLQFVEPPRHLSIQAQWPKT